MSEALIASPALVELRRLETVRLTPHASRLTPPRPRLQPCTRPHARLHAPACTPARPSSPAAQPACLHAALLFHPPALSPLQAKEIAETLSRSRNVTYLPSGGGQSLLLSVGQAAAA